MRIKLADIKTNGYYGAGILAVVLTACFVLIYLLMHDPYKDLHNRIFEIAGKVNNYYREKPNYWKLSTDSAKEDNLIGDIKTKYAKYDFSVGQGQNGEISMPSDVSFDIALKHLSKSACIALSEYQIPEEKRFSLIKITINADGKITEFSWGAEPKLPVKKYAARNVCSAKENAVIWTFQ